MEDNRPNALLPYLWLIWSDDVLTAEEFAAVNAFIATRSWLLGKQKDALAEWTDIHRPPSRALLEDWHSQIRLVATSQKPKDLFGLALSLSGNDPVIAKQREDFLLLDHQLGLSGDEAVALFRPDTGATSHHRQAQRFDRAAMAALLDGADSEILHNIRERISQPDFRYFEKEDTAAYRQHVMQWCRILADEGYGSLAYPKAYGGKNDVGAYFALMEGLSYHDLSLVIKFGVQFGLWGMSVYLLGTEKHHKKYLRDIGKLALPGCFAMTETHHGSNVKGLETTATYDPEQKRFIIHTPHPGAQKEYIGNAALHGRMATVFARIIVEGNDYGIGAFVVPLRGANGRVLKGITIGDCGHKTGLNGVDNGTISFDNVAIPKENMLDRFASVSDDGRFESPIPSDNRRFFTMLGTLVGGRIGIPRSALSAAKSALTIAIRYADGRRQFGPEGGSEVPILNYRLHQRRLLVPLAKTYAMHFSLRHLTDRFLRKKEAEAQEIEALAAGMKAKTTWLVRDIVQECREACGGKGYLSENRIGILKDDTEIYTTFEGDNHVLMQLVAKNRLSEFRKRYGNMQVGDVVSYLYEQARTVVAEKNPLATRRTDETHLMDPDFHQAAFAYRETTMVASAARRLKRLIDGGMEAYDAFNVVQPQLIAMADAWLDRIVLERFRETVLSVKEPGIRAVLERVYLLYALSEMERHKAWYLEEGYMEGAKTKAIRKTVSQLCWELRPDAVPLTDAFSIPENALAAPIAMRPA